MAREWTFDPSTVRDAIDEPAPWQTIQPRRGIRIEQVRRALAGREADSVPKVPGMRESSILLPLFEEDGEARIVLIRRSEHVGSHRGQLAFPGGLCDPGESARAAALREAHEEIGIVPGTVEIAGGLDAFHATFVDFHIAAFVGILPGRPEFIVNDAEVGDVLDVALTDLLADGAFREELWTSAETVGRIAFFEVGATVIWGATATFLLQLLCLVTGAPDTSGRTHPSLDALRKARGRGNA